VVVHQTHKQAALVSLIRDLKVETLPILTPMQVLAVAVLAQPLKM
jgi:hypothetical protein